MGKNNKRSPVAQEDIKEKKGSSSLPSFGLAEDVLGPRISIPNQSAMYLDCYFLLQSEILLVHVF